PPKVDSTSCYRNAGPLRQEASIRTRRRRLALTRADRLASLAQHDLGEGDAEDGENVVADEQPGQQAERAKELAERRAIAVAQPLQAGGDAGEDRAERQQDHREGAVAGRMRPHEGPRAAQG